MSENEKIAINPRLTKLIVSAIGREYAPAATITEATDFFTTIDILEIISGFAVTDLDTVTQAMIDAGYSIATIEGAAYWLLRKI